MLHNLAQVNWLVSLLAAVAMSVAASVLGGIFTRLLRLLVFFSLASAINTLGNLPERMVPETPSVVASALSTLFYLMSVLQGVETLRKLARFRHLGAGSVVIR